MISSMSHVSCLIMISALCTLHLSQLSKMQFTSSCSNLANFRQFSRQSRPIPLTFSATHIYIFNLHIYCPLTTSMMMMMMLNYYCYYHRHHHHLLLPTFHRVNVVYIVHRIYHHVLLHYSVD